MRAIILFQCFMALLKALTINSVGNKDSLPGRFTTKRDEQGQTSSSRTTTGLSDLSNQEAIYELDMLCRLLKSFIHEIVFYDVEFDARAESISKDLDELGFLIGNGDKRTNEIMERLNYVRALFRIMKEASAYLKYYQVRGTDQQLVRSIIQFNVGLLLFFDVQGSPDVSMPGYMESLRSLSRILKGWKIMFSFLEKVPLGLGSIFHTETRKATFLLNFLNRRYFENTAYDGGKFLTNFVTGIS